MSFKNINAFVLLFFFSSYFRIGTQNVDQWEQVIIVSENHYEDILLLII